MPHQDDGSRAGALRAMYAAAVELLLHAPIRVDNLAALEIGRHLLQIQAGGTRTVHL
ncbi:hypothetical protein [Geminicoccus flavidas]|uniref:hypothetical protein n=1 Tax=Geminicoccus flavidas TaxID=2506407 RepID=UPI00135969F3|nr:hypothetical protein [Geminicoccus flavidas]